jgi:hypothetical protein
MLWKKFMEILGKFALDDLETHVQHIHYFTINHTDSFVFQKLARRNVIYISVKLVYSALIV